MGERIRLVGGTRNFTPPVYVEFLKTGVSQIDKKTVFICTWERPGLFWDNLSGGSVFQLALKNPKAGTGSCQFNCKQVTSSSSSKLAGKGKGIGKDVFKALRASTAVAVSMYSPTITGWGIFNVFAILVIEKTRRYCHFAVRLDFQHQMSPQFFFGKGQ